MDKLTAIKIKYDDGTYSDEIPVSVFSKNVEWDSTHTLVDVLGSIDVDAKGTIQDQIDKLSNNNTQFDTQLASINDNLNDFAINFTNVLGNVDVSTKGTLQDQIDKLSAQGAGAHNSIYRGKNLGTSVTYKQWAAITAGTFDDLYIGDYWVINGKTWRIAAFDYFLHNGDTECTTHHAVIVPDEVLYNAQMNTTNDTTGGYVAVKKRGVLTDAETAIKAAFSASHILSHRVYLTNAVANGKASGGAWLDTICDIMNEEMIYGTGIFSPTSEANHRVEKSQLPLFAHEPSRINNRTSYWLRDVVTAAYFAFIDGAGIASSHNAASSLGVRPAFCIS